MSAAIKTAKAQYNNQRNWLLFIEKNISPLNIKKKIWKSNSGRQWTHPDNPPSILDIKTTSSHNAKTLRTETWIREGKKGVNDEAAQQYILINLQRQYTIHYKAIRDGECTTTYCCCYRLENVFFSFSPLLRHIFILRGSIRPAFSREQKICKWCCFGWWCFARTLDGWKWQSIKNIENIKKKPFRAKTRINNLFNWIELCEFLVD